ncbi:MAG: DUF4231 domain-containing protein [Sphingomonadales bacterium]
MTMDSGYERLEDQIAWYDRKSLWHQKQYKVLKVVSMVAAALVPLTSVTPWPIIPGALGVVVVIVEGLQQMNQHHRYWVQYRQTCEQLRREKFLYIGRTGSYNLSDAKAFRLLVENVEALVSDDNASWMQGRRDSEQKPREQDAEEETAQNPAPATTLP